MKDRFGNPLVNAELAISFLLIIILTVLESIIQLLFKKTFSKKLNKTKKELFIKGIILNVSGILFLLGNISSSFISLFLILFSLITSAFVYQNLFKKTITRK
jgi:hypothetical protein